MTNIESLAAIFGGRAGLAEACGVDPAMISRWNKPIDWKRGGHRGNGGRLPTKYNARVLEAAGSIARGLVSDDAMSLISAVNACLDAAICPTCGRALDDGHVV